MQFYSAARFFISHFWRILTLVLVQTGLLAGAAFAERYKYHFDLVFEEKIASINPQCMPERYVIVERNYVFRFLESTFGECVTANTTKAQVEKYAYLVTRSAVDPATATFTAAELKLEGLKCTLRTLVSASDDLNYLQKNKWKDLINKGFTLNDWVDFIKGIPDLSSPNKAKAAQAQVNTLLSLMDRGPEAADFSTAVISAANAGRNYVSDALLGERKVALNAVRYNLDHCRYSEAEKYLELARKATDADCIYAGHSFRQQELNLRRYGYDYRNVLRTPYGQGNEAKIGYDNRHDYLLHLRARLEEFEQHYKDLDELEKEIANGPMDFFKKQTVYAVSVGYVRQYMNSGKFCYGYDRLQELLKEIPQGCHARFFEQATLEPNPNMVRPDVLDRELYNAERERVAQWWAEADEIQTLFRQCNESEANSRLAALKSKITANPVLDVRDGQCRALESQVIKDRLAASRKRPHCERTTVPRIEGEKLADALKMLREASLVTSGRAVMVEPNDDQEGGIVIAADPQPGDKVTIWTGVALTVTSEPPKEEEETVAVPEVVGMDEGPAADLVNGAGLVAVVDNSTPADKIEYEPSKVFAVNPVNGTKLVLKSKVVIKAYGPRPMIEVPEIGGPDITAAKGIITAAGFTAGEKTLGDPAPEEDKVGHVYGSIPAMGSTAEMFSTVQPLIYGPRGDADVDADTRPIPPVLGKTAIVAQGMLTKDGFFSVGSISPGNPVREGEKPYTIQTAVPAVGTPQIKGTVVNLRIAMPLVQEEDQEEAEPAPPPVTEEAGDSWIGSWHITGKIGQDPLDEHADIGQINGRLQLSIAGEVFSSFNKVLLLRLDENNNLRIHPDTVQEYVDIENGLQGEEARKYFEGASSFMRAFKVTREGTLCHIYLATNGLIYEQDFNCVREGPSRQ